MKNCESCKVNQDKIEREVRKTLKNLDMSFVDAVMILIQGFNVMCHSFQEKNGLEGLKELFDNVDEFEDNILDACFHICSPINQSIALNMEKKDNNGN